MRRVRVAVLIVLNVALLLGASRTKLWDLDLAKLTKQDASATELVWGLQFSPDESKLAIGFGSLWDHDSRPRRVVIVDVTHPKSVLREFQFDSKFPILSNNSIRWSPSGQTLIVDRHIMFRLGEEQLCSFPEDSRIAGFLSDDRMVISQGIGSWPDVNDAIQILRSDCSLAESWQTANRTRGLLADPYENLLAISQFEGNVLSREQRIDLVDAQSHETPTVTLKGLATYAGGFVFADRGKVVCSGFQTTDRREPDLACWNTKTGSKIAENNRVSLDNIAIDGSGGDLIAFTDYKFIYRDGKIWQFLDLRGRFTSAKRHLIWSYRNAQEIASWAAPYQIELCGQDERRASKINSLFALSLSSAGKYLAEAGRGSVSLYSVRP